MPSDSGNSFCGPVYRDGWSVIVGESTATTALACRTGITAAAYLALREAANKTTAADRTGLVEMGGGDALELIVLGTTTADTTINMLVTTLSPIHDSTGGAPVAYKEESLLSAVWTLGALTFGSTITVAGLDSGDLYADTVTTTFAKGTSGFVRFSPADDTIASYIIPADQSQALLVRTDVGTAVSAIVLARRVQGSAQRA